jgi:hypothetical protein
MSFEDQTWWNVYTGAAVWAKSYTDMPKQPRPPYVPPPAEEPYPAVWYDDTELATACRNVGYVMPGLQVAIAVFLAESNNNLNAYNDHGNNPPTSVDRGPCQFNNFHHPEVSKECAYDMQCAVTNSFRVSGGTNFTQWSAYNAGTYLAYMDRAAAAIAATEPGQPDYDDLFNAAWNGMGIAWNPTAAFFQYAAKNGLLGIPMCNEFDFTVDCAFYRGQVYHKDGTWLVYAPVDQWDKTTHVQVG